MAGVVGRHPRNSRGYSPDGLSRPAVPRRLEPFGVNLTFLPTVSSPGYPEHILATAVELNVKAACRAVVVTALNPAAFSWWQRFGFDPFDAKDSTNLDLYLLTKDTAATLAKL